LLEELGKATEGRTSLRRVFTYPDRGLSHALARGALRASPNARRPRSGL
jgi:hypothetical protein